MRLTKPILYNELFLKQVYSSYVHLIIAIIKFLIEIKESTNSINKKTESELINFIKNEYNLKKVKCEYGYLLNKRITVSKYIKVLLEEFLNRDTNKYNTLFDYKEDASLLTLPLIKIHISDFNSFQSIAESENQLNELLDNITNRYFDTSKVVLSKYELVPITNVYVNRNDKSIIYSYSLSLLSNKWGEELCLRDFGLPKECRSSESRKEIFYTYIKEAYKAFRIKNIKDKFKRL